MIKKLFIKYKEIIVYVFFGVLTTLFNWGVYWVSLRAFDHLFSKNTVLVAVSNIVAWTLAVIFAYVTNKLFVFESKSWKRELVVKEAIGFVGARGITGIIEELALVAAAAFTVIQNYSIEFIGFKITGNMVSKIIVSVIVMVLNYVFSKFIVFRSRNKKCDITDGDASELLK